METFLTQELKQRTTGMETCLVLGWKHVQNGWHGNMSRAKMECRWIDKNIILFSFEVKPCSIFQRNCKIIAK